jgi:hypothetical protein
MQFIESHWVREVHFCPLAARPDGAASIFGGGSIVIGPASGSVSTGGELVRAFAPPPQPAAAMDVKMPTRRSRG